MASDNMENVATEQEILDSLATVNDEHEDKNDDESKENETEEFDKLHSMIPHLTSKSVTQLDIVLEAITYINLLQNKLIDDLQV